MHRTGSAKGFWALLTDDEQRVLSDIGLTRIFAPGATMCTEGDPATHVFVLVDGRVKILSATNDGQRPCSRCAARVTSLGKSRARPPGTGTATVQAIDTVRALIVGYGKFNSFLDSHLGADQAYRRMFTRRWSDTARCCAAVR